MHFVTGAFIFVSCLGKILIVGHDLQAKCDVANALCRQKKRFRILACRNRCLSISMKNATMAGRSIQVILSPNLDTPGWKHAIFGMNRNAKDELSIVYVMSSSMVDINHNASMQKVEREIGNRQTIVVEYFLNNDDMVERENIVAFCKTSQFDNKCKAVGVVFQKINEMYSQRTENRGEFSVPGRGAYTHNRVYDLPKQITLSKEEEEKIKGK